jgi:hypothetical protein
MQTSWSHGQATLMQRHQFLESQVNQIWIEPSPNKYWFVNEKYKDDTMKLGVLL